MTSNSLENWSRPEYAQEYRCHSDPERKRRGGIGNAK
jgi:hypothetical protein